MFLKSTVTPFNVAVEYHGAMRIEGNILDPNAQLTVTVHSWPSEESFIALGGKNPTYLWHIGMPALYVVGAALQDSLENALVQFPLEGSPFQGAILCPTPTTLDLIRARKWAYIKHIREAKIVEPITVDGRVFDADADSLSKIEGAVKAMRLTSLATQDWTLHDNTVYTLTVDALEQVGLAIFSRTAYIFEVARTLREQIYDISVTDPNTIEAIEWPAPPNPETPAPTV